MYRYETHLHTYPVSKCAKSTVEETLFHYKKMGYAGVFITNHFLDGNINTDRSLPYEEQINFYFSDYENGCILAKDVGIQVFLGLEISYKGTDFLVYGLDKQWFLKNPQIMNLPMRKKLDFLRKNGAFIVQAHPYREASYIDHIRLFPRSVDGVEVINACRPEAENKMAKLYAQNYGLFEIAGSDTHFICSQSEFAGVECDEPISSEEDFIRRIKNKDLRLFFITKSKAL